MRCVEFDLEGDMVRSDVVDALEMSAAFEVERFHGATGFVERNG